MPKWMRDYLPSLMLSGLVLLQGLAGALEWSYLAADTPQAALKQDAHSASDSPSAQADEPAGFELPALDEFNATIERPLFAEGRQPPSEEELDAGTPVVSTPLTLKLMGVMLTPRQHAALLQDAKGKYKRMRRNDTLDGWTLIAIADDKVTLQQGSQQKDLILLKPHPKPPAPGTGQSPHPKPIIQQDGEEPSEEVDNTEEVSTEETPDEEPADSGD